MRAQIHTQRMDFRAHPTLVAAAEEKARERGMSLSELLRQALRREVLEDA